LNIQNLSTIRIQNQIQAKIINFLVDEGPKNQWLQGSGFKIYVRKSKRCPNNILVSCFDLAAIEFDEKLREHGILTELLHWLIDELTKYKFDAIFVECVVSKRLGEFLEKSGFVAFPEYPNCYFFVLQNETRVFD